MGKIKAISIQIIIAATLIMYAHNGLAQPNLAEKVEIIDGVKFHHYNEKVNGISLHFVRGGKGLPILLLYGYPETWYEWRKVMPALSEKYTVIAIDLRGSGSSAKPDSGYDTKTMAKDIYELTQKLKLEKIVLLGHDIGGMVVFAYAHLYPKTLKGIGIFENPIPGFQPIWQAANDNPKTWWFKFHATPEIPEILVKGREKEYVRFFINYVTFNKAAFTEKDFDVYAESMKDAKNLTGGFNYYRAFSEDVKQNKVFIETKVKVPVLGLGGDHSLWLIQNPTWTALAEKYTVVKITNAGHYITEENPSEVIQAITSFISSL